jgi:hypothetical protein
LPSGRSRNDLFRNGDWGFVGRLRRWPRRRSRSLPRSAWAVVQEELEDDRKVTEASLQFARQGTLGQRCVSNAGQPPSADALGSREANRIVTQRRAASPTTLQTGSCLSRERDCRRRSAEPTNLPSAVGFGVVECAVRSLDQFLNGTVGRLRNCHTDTARERHCTLGGHDLR